MLTTSRQEAGDHGYLDEQSPERISKLSEAQKVKDGPEAQESHGQIQPCDKELSVGDQTPHRPWLVPGAGRL